MQQSRLIKYIKELSPKQRERFQLFVESPYFNQHEATTALLKIVLCSFKDAKISLVKEKVHKKLFPGEKYDEQQLHNVMSYLKKLYHRFLAIQRIESRPLEEQLLTLEAANDNNQFDLLKNRSKQLEKTLQKEKFKNSQYHFINYRLNNLIGFYEGGFIDRSKTERFQSMLYHLDSYFIAEKLRQSAVLTANTMLMNTKYDFRFLDELLAYIEKNWDFYKENLTIALYYSCINTLRDANNPVHYQRLKSILDDHVEQLSAWERNDLYEFSQNYCVTQIHLGNSEFKNQLFEIYKHGLDTGHSLTQGILSEWHYKNITTLGCNLKEFDWTENFIHQFKDFLLEDVRENAYNYNLANLNYNRKRYNDALSALLLVNFSDVNYHLGTTFLLLRTYYALKDTEALLSLIETSRIYVMRNKKMTTFQKRGYSNFLRFARKLVLLKHHAGTYSKKVLGEKLENLAEKIQNTENVLHRYWLLEESST